VEKNFETVPEGKPSFSDGRLRGSFFPQNTDPDAGPDTQTEGFMNLGEIREKAIQMMMKRFH